MDVQINEDKLKEYSSRLKSGAAAILWLIGTTLVAFLLYAVLQAVLFGILVNPEQPQISSVASDIAFYGGIVIPLFLPAAILHWKKIRPGKKATGILTALCGVSLMIDLLFVGLACLLRLINGLFPHAHLFIDWVLETSILLIFGIFVRMSLLISLLANSENPKRTTRFILLGSSLLEIALLTFFMCCG